jgi:hypothetical protein
VGGDKPSKEVFLHRAVLTRGRMPGAVVHLHSTHATAIACLAPAGRTAPIPPLTPYFVMRIGPRAARVIPYYRPGDAAMEPAIHEAAKSAKAVLLANHGPVVSGRTLADAVYAAEELEEAARLALLLRDVPGARRLTPGAGGRPARHLRLNHAAMWIMVAGPYSSGGADAAMRAGRLAALNQAALALFRMGHVPVVGVNMALPVIAVAGDASFDEIMMPLSLALAERCDACLRIGGASAGADAEAARFAAAGKPVFHAIEEIPTCPQHFVAEAFQAMAGVKLTHVPYRGTPAAVLALRQGEVQLVVETVAAVLGQVRGGEARAIALSTAQRFPGLPDVPTMRESGLAEFDLATWFTIGFPAGVPAAAVARIEAETRRALSDPDLAARMREMGLTPVGSDSATAAAVIRRDIARWRDLVASAGIPQQE